MASTTLTTLTLTLEAEKGIVQHQEVLNIPGILNKGIDNDNSNPIDSKPTAKESVNDHGLINGTANQENDLKKEHQITNVQLRREIHGDGSDSPNPLPNTQGGEQVAEEKEDSNADKSTLKQQDKYESIQGLSKPQQNKFESFLSLAKPQQDILLLHGPGQRYSLDKARDIPKLESDQEVLIQVSFLFPLEVVY